MVGRWPADVDIWAILPKCSVRPCRAVLPMVGEMATFLPYSCSRRTDSKVPLQAVVCPAPVWYTVVGDSMERPMKQERIQQLYWLHREAELYKDNPFLQENRKRVLDEIDYLESWLASIEDPQTRAILTLRCKQGLQWGEVAQAMGKHVKTSSVRTRVKLFFRRINKES